MSTAPGAKTRRCCAAAADLDADCVLRLCALIRGDAQIMEIEIDPLRVLAQGTLALDVLIHAAD